MIGFSPFKLYITHEGNYNASEEAANRNNLFWVGEPYYMVFGFDVSNILMGALFVYSPKLHIYIFILNSWFSGRTDMAQHWKLLFVVDVPNKIVSLDEVFGLLRRMCMVIGESLMTRRGGNCNMVIRVLMKLQIIVLTLEFWRRCLEILLNCNNMRNEISLPGIKRWEYANRRTSETGCLILPLTLFLFHLNNWLYT